MNLQNKLSLLVNADPDCIDKENCDSKEDNSCSSTKEENCDNVNNQDSSSSVTLKTDSPTKLMEPDTLKAAIELHDLITGAAESPLKQECLKASEKFLKKFQAHLDDAEEENEDTEVQVGNTKPVTDNQHIQKEGGQYMAQKVVLTKNERKAVVDGLITNEACCWEESDREVLNELNDTTLAKLHRQIELVGNAEMSDILGEDDEEDVAVEEEKTKEGDSQADGKVAPTGDLDPGKKGEPATNALSEQDRRDLAFARHYRMAQRKQHIGVITANANNKFTAKQLDSMDDRVLANMALLAKTQEENDEMLSMDAMSRPNFFGAQGAAVINTKTGIDDEPLMLGKIDYKELAANNGRK